MNLEYYLEQLENDKRPDFLEKYLKSPSLKRLQKVGYFCGMDYASKDIYDFEEYITRFDHSLSVSLMVYKLTKDEKATLAGLFHDIATPCFSHVIDYMNKDYEKQESTEALTETILEKDTYLKECLQKDQITLRDISNFKRYPIVDNERPKVCADRIDGVILTGIGWTKNITQDDIHQIIKEICVEQNEQEEKEIGFKTIYTARRVMEINHKINEYCHSKEDNYMMQLLANITKYAIKKKIISYEDLYYLNEEELYSLLKEMEDKKLKEMLTEFETIQKKDIPRFDIPKIKERKLTPLVNGIRVR